MGKLEAVYRIRLSFPLLAHAITQEPAVIKFADTNNSVSIEYPKPGPAPEQPELKGFDEIVLRVERECTTAEADIRAQFLNNFQMDRDAVAVSVVGTRGKGDCERKDCGEELAQYRNHFSLILP